MLVKLRLVRIIQYICFTLGGIPVIAVVAGNEWIAFGGVGITATCVDGLLFISEQGVVVFGRTRGYQRLSMGVDDMTQRPSAWCGDCVVVVTVPFTRFIWALHS